jgi:hypothetical protein
MPASSLRLAYEAFHNVAYFPATFEEAKAALAQNDLAGR